MESSAKGMITREDTKGFKNYAGVGKEEGFVTASCPASASFYVFEGCYQVLRSSSPEKNQQPLLVLSANGPLLSNPLFGPSAFPFASLWKRDARHQIPSQRQPGPSRCRGGSQGYTAVFAQGAMRSVFVFPSNSPAGPRHAKPAV